MRIKANKDGRRVKLDKRERDNLVTTGNLAADLHAFAIADVKDEAKAVADAVTKLLVAIDKHEAK